MNKQRRKAIQDLFDKITEARDYIDAIREEEEEYRENIPENLQGSERYEIAESAVSNLEYAVSSLEEALDYLETASE